jgi:hypothetical protein
MWSYLPIEVDHINGKCGEVLFDTEEGGPVEGKNAKDESREDDRLKECQFCPTKIVMAGF